MTRTVKTALQNPHSDPIALAKAIQNFRDALKRLGGSIVKEDQIDGQPRFIISPADGRGEMGIVFRKDGTSHRSWITSPKEWDERKKRHNSKHGTRNPYHPCSTCTDPHAVDIQPVGHGGMCRACRAGSEAWVKLQRKKLGAIDKEEKKRNPQADADAGFESFHGEPSGETVVIEDQIHEHDHLWVCGRLIELCVVTVTGIYLNLSWDGRKETDTPYLCSSEDGKQLYIEGGDQELDLKAIHMDGERWVKDRMVIGEFAPPDGKRKYNITYRTKKDFDKFEEIDYQHWLGEPSKDLKHPAAPFLEYEPRNQKLYITGGQYIITKPLFGTSPGIEN